MRGIVDLVYDEAFEVPGVRDEEKALEWHSSLWSHVHRGRSLHASSVDDKRKK
jgi:hypothetical protein